MPISLHAAFVPTARQMIAAVQGLIDKAEQHCEARRIKPDVLLSTRVIADMFDLGYQLKSVAVHTGGAIKGVRAGQFGLDMAKYPPEFAAYRAVLTEADTELGGVSEAEMESWIGRDVTFGFGDFRREFNAENFLLSFSQPNYMFHAATAYGILRGQGVPIGKFDFLGQPLWRD